MRKVGLECGWGGRVGSNFEWCGPGRPLREGDTWLRLEEREGIKGKTFQAEGTDSAETQGGSKPGTLEEHLSTKPMPRESSAGDSCVLPW